MRLSHTFIPAGSARRRTDPLTQPDDITVLDGRLFTGFQNGIGARGEASTDGNLYSIVVEFTFSGRPIRKWDVKGARAEGSSIRAPQIVPQRAKGSLRTGPRDSGVRGVSMPEGSYASHARTSADRGTCGRAVPQPMSTRWVMGCEIGELSQRAEAGAAADHHRHGGAELIPLARQAGVSSSRQNLTGARRWSRLLIHLTARTPSA